MFEHNFDTFSVYTKTQIVDKQLSPPHKVMASRCAGMSTLLSFL